MAQPNEDDLLEDTTQEEKKILCSVVRATGSKISGLLFVAGLLILLFGIYLFVTVPDPAISARLSIIFTGFLGFAGALNIMGGLLLLLGEEEQVCAMSEKAPEKVIEAPDFNSPANEN